LQRWLCRKCGFRFSQSRGKILKNSTALARERRVCAEGREAKNLAISGAQDGEAQRGAATIETVKIQDFLKDFADMSRMKGLNERTIENWIDMLSLLHKRGADLLDPESVFNAIDRAKLCSRSTGVLLEEEWSDGSKNNAAKAYIAFCAFGGVSIPQYLNFKKWSKVAQKKPWIPQEREVDELIAGCSRRVGAFLQLLKETGARPGEAWQLKWTDIDVERSIVTYNDPEKGSNARQIKVSDKCIAMLNVLPKDSKRIFGDGTLDHFRTNFALQRARMADKLQDPRLKLIMFRTLRHLCATMLLHRCNNLVVVQERLGHKSILSTMVYTHLVNFEGDEYDVATARTLEEFKGLLAAGFDHVDDMDGYKVCRRRK